MAVTVETKRADNEFQAVEKTYLGLPCKFFIFKNHTFIEFMLTRERWLWIGLDQTSNNIRITITGLIINVIINLS